MAGINSFVVSIFALVILNAHGSSQNDRNDQKREEAQETLQNVATTYDGTQSSRYVVQPQAYYVPQPYQLTQTPNYESQVNQVPVVIGSTQKKILPQPYKIVLDTPKYVAAQNTKEVPATYSTQSNYPYLYTVAKVVPTVPPSYGSTVVPTSNYYEGEPKKYQYGYRVSNPYTGTEFGHSEVNNGHTAKGYYHVLLPDGRLQNVKYWAGPSGYHATISYENKY